MIYTWFRIFNLQEFLDADLPSKTYTLNLQGIGKKEILVTHGNGVGITYDSVFLLLELNERNPFEFEDRAVYLDKNTNDVYLGIAVES